MGERMREAVYINLGLLALKKCIEALNKNNKAKATSSRPRDEYVPYQDSKLTMLLSAGLGGCSKTSVVVCGSMANADAVETLQALRFGEKCSSIHNNAQIKKSAVESMLAKIDKEMSALEDAIREKEHWVTERVVHMDTSEEALARAAAQQSLAIKGSISLSGAEEENESGTAVQVLEQEQEQERGHSSGAAKDHVTTHVTKLVGAEAEREKLEALIRKRAALTGQDVKSSLIEHGFGFAKKANAA